MTKPQLLQSLDRQYANALTHISRQSTCGQDYTERCDEQDETFGAVVALVERAPQWLIEEIVGD